MVNFILPDFQDTRDTIADYVSSLRIAPGGQHERIVENSMIPIALLFKASEMACAAGSEEQAVFAYFLSLLHAQADGLAKPLAPVSGADEASRSS
ncbi:MAG TPA: hypothetical protein VF472_04730 [Burkholderiaceae bacterium]